MSQSQFEAKTFGLGELIAQRKLFRVPRHQRSYSWNTDAVESFLSDIDDAFQADATQYFVGLIVIQGPEDGEWVLLDGQQRLTTTTMIYACIRDWLREAQLVEDAKQIETDFLGVRRLGGSYSARMLLNDENAFCFNSIIINTSSYSLPVKSHPRNSSNRLLCEAYYRCKALVNDITATHAEKPEKARALFRLAGFLETRVKTVCVEVSSEVDAYILFESLNDRGVALSALDLVKNYIFSVIPRAEYPEAERMWTSLARQLDGTNHDDFLKIFWTSRFGIIQKDQLFRRMREQYPDCNAVFSLLHELVVDSDILNAINDQSSELWSSFPHGARESIFVLNSISAKQARPILLAAYHALHRTDFTAFLKDVISAIVRFQIIGRQRPGIVERVFGRACARLRQNEIRDICSIRDAIREIYIDDDTFITAFAKHRETKPLRTLYFLAEIEKHEYSATETVEQIIARKTISPLFVAKTAATAPQDEKSDLYGLLANFTLVDKDKDAPSQLLLDQHNVATAIEERGQNLARTANYIWRIDFPGSAYV